MNAQPPPIPFATKLRKSEMAGSGCVVQGLGVLIFIVSLFFGPIGWAIGALSALCLLLAGGRMAIYWVCGSCRNRIEKQSKMCPVCKAYFGS